MVESEEQDLLLDCWMQFAIRSDDGRLWHGYLSTLEWLEAYLRRHGLIDEAGQPIQDAELQ